MGATLSIVKHGCYNETSEYVICQIKYLGCKRGYVELIEVFENDSPTTHFIVNRYLDRGTPNNSLIDYAEWTDLESAQKALDLFLENSPIDIIKRSHGFVYYEKIHPKKKPWFYKN